MALTFFDYSNMIDIIEQLCSKKIAYDYPMLSMIPKARGMVFDSLVPLTPLADFNDLEICATKELDAHLRQKGIANGPEKLKSVLCELKVLWEAERKLRDNLEKLRMDERFRLNGFYEGCVRLIRLDSKNNLKGSILRSKSRKDNDILDRDIRRVLARLEFFWKEVVDPDEVAPEMRDIPPKVENSGELDFFEKFMHTLRTLW
jgi:hypothetical protein